MGERRQNPKTQSPTDSSSDNGEKAQTATSNIASKYNAAALKDKNKLTIILAVVVVILIAAVVLFLALHKPSKTVTYKTSTAKIKVTGAPNASSATSKIPPVSSAVPSGSGYQDAANNFISAVQNKDQAAADKLQSPTFTALNTSQGNPSYESACKTKGNSCESFFNKQTLSKAVKTNSSYALSSGATGETITWTTNANYLAISVTEVNGTYLIDNVNTH